MGANFVTIEYTGILEAAQVRLVFQERQEQDRYENGNSYSGTIGMANGLRFYSGTFATSADANVFLQEYCKKYGPAVAVKVREPNRWLIGAWCQS